MKAKNGLKKTLACLLAVVLMLTGAPLAGLADLDLSGVADWFSTTAQAATTYYYAGDLTYTVEDGEAMITDCDDEISGELVIPSTLGGYPVTSIGYDAFEYCRYLTSVTIPDSVTSIDNSAFRGCTGLTSVTIPDSVTYIGNNAFYNTSWYNSQPDGVVYAGKVLYKYKGTMPENTSIVIREGTKSIAGSAFSGCTGLTSVTIPDSVTRIGYEAFKDFTGLTSITIPNSVTSIDARAFYNCTGLTSITIPDSVTSIGGSAFYGCTGLTSITIPYSVTSIGYSAFDNCTGLTKINWNAESVSDFVFSGGAWYYIFSNAGTSGDGIDVVFGYNVKSIPARVFYNVSSIKSVTIGNSVTSIGDYAFRDCTGLKKINWNAESVSDYSSSVFSNAGTAGDGIDVVFGNNVKSIPAYAFDDVSSIKSVIIGNSVTSIGGSAFSGCTSLTKINWNAESVRDFVDSWGGVYNVFSNAGTAEDGIEVVFGDSVKSIPAYVFYNVASIKSVIVGNSVTRIGEYAFKKCTGLASVTIGNSVTSIGDSAFSGCNGLTSITIPVSVTNIGSSAFENCTGLTSVTIPDSVESIGISAFDGTAWYNAQPFGDVYAGKVYYKYKGTMLENTSITIKDGTKGIAGGAFYCCYGLVDVTIPNGVTNIGDEAFSNCGELTDLTIPGSVKIIGDSAFANRIFASDNVGLKRVKLENGIEIIGNNAFAGCCRLSNINFPDSVTFIGDSAFSDCFQLANVHIPGSVKYIGKDAFDFLTLVILDEGIEIIGNNAFRGTEISQIVIPDSVKSVGNYAFSSCGSLTTVTIGSGIETILSGTFQNCPNITTIKIKKGLKVIEKDAFNGIKAIPDIFFEGSEEEWKAISIDQSNDMILRANMHYNADLSHEHSYTETVKEATCTEDGLRTFTCSCGRSYTEKIPATGHDFDYVVVEPTCISIGYETNTCKNCGLSYFVRSIPATGHHDYNGDGRCDACSRKMSEAEEPDKRVVADEKTGVTVEFPLGTFGGNVILSTETVTEGKVFEIVNAEKGNFKKTVYNITTLVNGTTAQPNGTVSVKIPLPADYSAENSNVYYVSEDGKLEQLDCRVENGFIVFETDHFSYYAVVDESENSVTPKKCTCACHKKGIVKFFFKIGLFFQRIFKKNKVCKCGAWHY